MTKRQKKFAEVFVDCGDAEESVIRAGYSKKAADKNAYRLLRNEDVESYINKLNSIAESQKFLSIDQCRGILSEIAKTKDNSASERIKAIDMLLTISREEDKLKRESEKNSPQNDLDITVNYETQPSV